MLRLIVVVSLLVACGGGGGGGSSPGTDSATSEDGRVTEDGSGPTTGCGPCNTPPTACHAIAGTCEAGVCHYAFVENASCNDGNACTVADTCAAGACAGTPLVCSAPPANV